MKGQFAVQLLCSVLLVSVSGYYRWRRQPRSKRQQHDEVLEDEWWPAEPCDGVGDADGDGKRPCIPYCLRPQIQSHRVVLYAAPDSGCQ